MPLRTLPERFQDFSGAAGQIRTADLVITKTATRILYGIRSCYEMSNNRFNINAFFDFWDYLVLRRIVSFFSGLLEDLLEENISICLIM